MRFQTLAEWLAWQESLHPETIDLGLERVSIVADRLGLLSPSYKIVTVAGTNGKGSSVAMLEAIALQAGWQVGAYTSPHLLRYNERIRLQGQEVSDAQLCAAFEAIDQARAEISLTYFEFGTLAALVIFAQANPDLVILEVGLGGRLDAVNTLDADVMLLTTVDLDHQAWLGETREEIGHEKAGIFRPGRPAIIGESNPPRSVLNYAEEIGAKLFWFQRDFGFEYAEDSEFSQTSESQWDWWSQNRQNSQNRELKNLPQPALAGEIQIQNAAAVLMVLQQLETVGLIADRDAIAQGLQNIQLAGRFQMIAEQPQVIVDVAHNPQAARHLAETLQAQPITGKTIAMVAMLNDKEAAETVRIMDREVDQWIVAGLDKVDRGRSQQEMEQVCADVGISTEKMSGFPTVKAAFQAAKAQASSEDRIVVFGSFYTVAAVFE